MEEKKSVRELLTTFDKPEPEPKNLTAQILFVVGWIVIFGGVFIGAILGGIMSTDRYANELNMSVFLISAVTGAVSGLLFISVSEIIKLLYHNLEAQNQIIGLLSESSKEEDDAAHVTDNSKEG